MGRRTRNNHIIWNIFCRSFVTVWRQEKNKLSPSINIIYQKQNIGLRCVIFKSWDDKGLRGMSSLLFPVYSPGIRWQRWPQYCYRIKIKSSRRPGPRVLSLNRMINMWEAGGTFLLRSLAMETWRPVFTPGSNEPALTRWPALIGCHWKYWITGKRLTINCMNFL